MSDNIVEISGHRYKYRYEHGKTIYVGPVGDAPPISEGDFDAYMKQISLTGKEISDLRNISMAMEGEVRLPKDVGQIIFDRMEEEDWAKVDAGKALRWFRDIYTSTGDEVDQGLVENMTTISRDLDGDELYLPIEIVNRVEGRVEEPMSAHYYDIHGPSGKMIYYFADMLS
jgi:hypothetical protein